MGCLTSQMIAAAHTDAIQNSNVATSVLVPRLASRCGEGFEKSGGREKAGDLYPALA
jgi:hypothetical protein